MRLSRTVEYAIQATLELARSEQARPVSCSELVTGTEMPEPFVLQILRRLVTRGILNSTRGVLGGYSLARLPEDISLLNLVEAVEGPVVGSFASNKVLSSGTHVQVLQALNNAADSTRTELSRLSMAQLLASPN
jgi:Rrf2 family transcriptional regulator, cysteine metabolism repressor